MTELERQEKDFKQIEANLREACEYERQLNQQIMGKLDAYENIMRMMLKMLVDKATDRR